MKRRVINAVCITVAIVLGSIIGWPVMAKPEPLGRDADFSAYRMADYIRVIAAEERCVNRPERRLYVRDYIIGIMEGFGLTPEIDDFSVTVTDYADRAVVLEGSNVLFRLQGRSDTAIMLMAHYDSRGVNWTLDPATEAHSPGAADAGYGLATMLEIARYFSGRDLENSIYFFFTDLEEVWLLGAIHAVETMDFSNVGLILNLEARGIRGPVYMFETHARDYNLMRFFNEATGHGVAYSVATAVYRIMPNLTDLTPFLAHGFAGMNFAPLNSLLYYHTELDSYENISHTTMQQYIEMIADVVEAFATDSRFSDVNYFQGGPSAVFFPLPFGIFILYTNWAAIAAAFIMLALVAVLITVLVRRGNLCPRKMLRWALNILAGMLAAALLGLLISLVIFAFNRDFPIHAIRFRGEFGVTGFATGTVLLLFGLFHRRMREKINRYEMAAGAMALFAVLNVISSFFLVGASFMILIPLALVYIAFLLKQIKVMRDKTVLCAFIHAVPVFLITIPFAPIMYSLALALSVTGLFVFLALSVLLSSPLLSLWRDS